MIHNSTFIVTTLVRGWIGRKVPRGSDTTVFPFNSTPNKASKEKLHCERNRGTFKRRKKFTLVYDPRRFPYTGGCIRLRRSLCSTARLNAKLVRSTRRAENGRGSECRSFRAHFTSHWNTTVVQNRVREFVAQFTTALIHRGLIRSEQWTQRACCVTKIEWQTKIMFICCRDIDADRIAANCTWIEKNIHRQWRGKRNLRYSSRLQHKRETSKREALSLQLRRVFYKRSIQSAKIPRLLDHRKHTAGRLRTVQDESFLIQTAGNVSWKMPLLLRAIFSGTFRFEITWSPGKGDDTWIFPGSREPSRKNGIVRGKCNDCLLVEYLR